MSTISLCSFINIRGLTHFTRHFDSSSQYTFHVIAVWPSSTTGLILDSSSCMPLATAWALTRRRCSLQTATATTTTTEMTGSRRQLRRPRRHTLRLQMQTHAPRAKFVSWHRARGSRWYPATMRAFARPTQTALLL